MSLPVANEIYNRSSNSKINWHEVNHRDLQAFCLAVSRFERSTMQVDDEFMSKFTRWLRRYRFKLCSAPLRFSHPAVIAPGTIENMSRLLKRLQLTYPGIASKARDLFDMASKLAQSNENPLLEYLKVLVNSQNSYKIALLIKDSSLTKHVEKVFSEHYALRKVQMLGTSQLQGGNLFDWLLVIGPARWFPEYIFDSPRASEIHLIRYNWIKDRWKREPAFLEYSLHASQDPVSGDLEVNSVLKEPRDLSEMEYNEPAELLPTINWDDINARLNLSTSQDDQTQEYVEARLFSLVGEGVVFLESSEKSKALVIDLEGDESEEDIDGNESGSRVKRIRVKDIHEGMFILLRTSGGGDYILPVADRILGDKAGQAREMQLYWKELLRDVVSKRGTTETSVALKSRGAVKASVTNVRNWMSTKTIRPQNYEDFEAIMSLIGLKEKVLDYWEVAIAIETAHRQAGHYIRNLLLKKVLHSDLSELEKTGRMDFELEQGDGGKLTAFRVEGFSPGLYTVPASRLGHYFERDEYAWQE
ncbi:DrmE family protein [Sporotomaculum syntrophicum]|nr:DrmE family protein [Sporotomaculum syntrophicum]